jgi:hypothetical protein
VESGNVLGLSPVFSPGCGGWPVCLTWKVLLSWDSEGVEVLAVPSSRNTFFVQVTGWSGSRCLLGTLVLQSRFSGGWSCCRSA